MSFIVFVLEIWIIIEAVLYFKDEVNILTVELSINIRGRIGEIILHGRLDAASSNELLEALSDKTLSGTK